MSVNRNFTPIGRHRAESDPGNIRLTPLWLVDRIRAALGGTIAVDPCTEDWNPTRARHIIAPPRDGCTESWPAGCAFVNPPYGRGLDLDRWPARIVWEAQAGRQIIAIVEAKTETLWYDLLTAHATHVLTVQGRVGFDGADVREAARTQTRTAIAIVLLGFNVDLTSLGDLGRVHSPHAASSGGAGISWYRRPDRDVRVTVAIPARDGMPPAGYVFVDDVRCLLYTSCGCDPPGLRVRIADGRPNRDEVDLGLRELVLTYPEYRGVCTLPGCEPRRARVGGGMPQTVSG